MAHLFISSTDSLDFHQTNSSFDFTVELPQTLTGSYKVALAEFYCTNQLEDLYVLSDVCEQSYCLDQMLPLMRIVHQPGECSNMYFLKVTRSDVQRIRIYIRNADLEIPSTDIGRVRCTLVFELI